jgi:ATP-dependent protease Clp ATPase subunit
MPFIELFGLPIRVHAQELLFQLFPARGLRSVLEGVQRTMYELPSHPDVARCLVGEDAVTGAGRVRFEYQDEAEAVKAAG